MRLAPPAAPAVLRLCAVHKSFAAGVPGCFARVRALAGVTLAVNAGDFIAVAGATGAGKSTLLLCAAGLLRPDAGAVHWSRAACGSAPRLYARAHDFPPEAFRARLLLLDDADGTEHALGSLRARGVTVVAAFRDARRAAAAGARVLTLREGRLEASAAGVAPPRRLARVAEPRAALR